MPGAGVRSDRVRVAAWQAPLLPGGSMEALDLVRRQVERCEVERVSILCCPEAILGGLADASDDPWRFAIALDGLEALLAPIASDLVTTIVGFTEGTPGGRLHNSAAVFHRGSVAGVYRKLHPAINRSVYDAGAATPVFRIDELTFGIAICNDSNFAEPARSIAAQGAAVLFVPTNNGLPPSKGGAELVAMARRVDVARAVENRLWVVRADVAGQADGLVSHGSSGIVDPDGRVVVAATGVDDLLAVDVSLRPHGIGSSH